MEYNRIRVFAYARKKTKGAHRRSEHGRMDFKTTELKLVNESEHQKKNWRLVMFGRRFLVLFALLVQFAVSFLLSWSGARIFAWVNTAFTVVGILLSLFIIQKKDSSGFKLLWVFFVLAAPIFGVTFYFVIRGQSSTKRMRKISSTISCQYNRAIEQIRGNVEKTSLGSYDRIATYLEERGGFLPCAGGKNTYYATVSEGRLPASASSIVSIVLPITRRLSLTPMEALMDAR